MLEQKPLFGRKIVLVRTSTEESNLANELRRNGAAVIEFPKWQKTKIQIDEAILAKIGIYEKILFTSSESVTDFFNRLVEHNIDFQNVTTELFGLSVKTLRALKAKGLTGYLAADMKDAGNLLIVGDQHIKEDEHLNKLKYGAHQLLIMSYNSIDQELTQAVARRIAEVMPDTLLFASSKSVQVLVNEVRKHGIETLIETAKVICMGEKTRDATKRFGINRVQMPIKPTKESLLECLTEMTC